VYEYIIVRSHWLAINKTLQLKKSFRCFIPSVPWTVNQPMSQQLSRNGMCHCVVKLTCRVELELRPPYSTPFLVIFHWENVTHPPKSSGRSGRDFPPGNLKSVSFSSWNCIYVCICICLCIYIHTYIYIHIYIYNIYSSVFCTCIFGKRKRKTEVCFPWLANDKW
jgi:hypothetical protein